MDSRCTSHLCSDIELFVNTKNVTSGLKLANNITAKVEAKIKITAAVNRKDKDIKLTDMLYVPELQTNLLSSQDRRQLASSLVH